jgi:hypothetical protein
MATTQERLTEPPSQDEKLLEQHEEVADRILEDGSIYREISERKNLEKNYDSLEPEEKWWYALEVLYSREGATYSSPRELIGEYRRDELELDDLPWNTTEWGDEHDMGTENLEENVEELKFTPMGDGRVTARAEVYIDGERDEGIVYRLIDSPEDWEDLM